MLIEEMVRYPFKIKELNGLTDILIWRNEKTRQTHCFCHQCGQAKRTDASVLKEHAKHCKTPFKPLQLGDKIPNNLASAYMNLEQHITQHEPLIPKKWTLKSSTRTELRRMPEEQWPMAVLSELQAMSNFKEGDFQIPVGVPASPSVKPFDTRIKN